MQATIAPKKSIEAISPHLPDKPPLEFVKEQLSFVAVLLDLDAGDYLSELISSINNPIAESLELRREYADLYEKEDAHMGNSLTILQTFQDLPDLNDANTMNGLAFMEAASRVHRWVLENLDHLMTDEAANLKLEESQKLSRSSAEFEKVDLSDVKKRRAAISSSEDKRFEGEIISKDPDFDTRMLVSEVNVLVDTSGNMVEAHAYFNALYKEFPDCDTIPSTKDLFVRSPLPVMGEEELESGQTEVIVSFNSNDCFNSKQGTCPIGYEIIGVEVPKELELDKGKVYLERSHLGPTYIRGVPDGTKVRIRYQKALPEQIDSELLEKIKTHLPSFEVPMSPQYKLTFGGTSARRNDEQKLQIANAFCKKTKSIYTQDKLCAELLELAGPQSLSFLEGWQGGTCETEAVRATNTFNLAGSAAFIATGPVTLKDKYQTSPGHAIALALIERGIQTCDLTIGSMSPSATGIKKANENASSLKELIVSGDELKSMECGRRLRECLLSELDEEKLGGGVSWNIASQDIEEGHHFQNDKDAVYIGTKPLPLGADREVLASLSDSYKESLSFEYLKIEYNRLSSIESRKFYGKDNCEKLKEQIGERLLELFNLAKNSFERMQFVRFFSENCLIFPSILNSLRPDESLAGIVKYSHGQGIAYISKIVLSLIKNLKTSKDALTNINLDRLLHEIEGSRDSCSPMQLYQFFSMAVSHLEAEQQQRLARIVLDAHKVKDGTFITQFVEDGMYFIGEDGLTKESKYFFSLLENDPYIQKAFQRTVEGNIKPTKELEQVWMDKNIHSADAYRIMSLLKSNRRLFEVEIIQPLAEARLLELAEQRQAKKMLCLPIGEEGYLFKGRHVFEDHVNELLQGGYIDSEIIERWPVRDESSVVSSLSSCSVKFLNDVIWIGMPISADQSDYSRSLDGFSRVMTHDDFHPSPSLLVEAVKALNPSLAIVAKALLESSGNYRECDPKNKLAIKDRESAIKFLQSHLTSEQIDRVLKSELRRHFHIQYEDNSGKANEIIDSFLGIVKSKEELKLLGEDFCSKIFNGVSVEEIFSDDKYQAIVARGRMRGLSISQLATGLYFLTGDRRLIVNFDWQFASQDNFSRSLEQVLVELNEGEDLPQKTYVSAVEFDENQIQPISFILGQLDAGASDLFNTNLGSYEIDGARQYVLSDDPRSINWHMTAKSNNVYVNTQIGQERVREHEIHVIADQIGFSNTLLVLLAHATTYLKTNIPVSISLHSRGGCIRKFSKEHVKDALRMLTVTRHGRSPKYTESFRRFVKEVQVWGMKAAIAVRSYSNDDASMIGLKFASHRLIPKGTHRINVIVGKDAYPFLKQFAKSKKIPSDKFMVSSF